MTNITSDKSSTKGCYYNNNAIAFKFFFFLSHLILITPTKRLSYCVTYRTSKDSLVPRLISLSDVSEMNLGTRLAQGNIWHFLTGEN
mgnify:CR=1 FL=1